MPKTIHKAMDGVALLTALLVVALVTVLATAMLKRQHLDLRRSGNLLSSDQAYVYALGAEGWAGRILARDRNGHDSLDEDWAMSLPPTPVEGGSLAGRLEDAQGRFNLNNLLDPQGQPSQPDLARFQCLLQALELPRGLAQVALDWLDPDSQPAIPDGAEDYAYLGQHPPYRAANQRFYSVSELRLLAGMDEAMYQRLAPLVTALPEITRINVNTAPLPLLQCLVENLPAYQAEDLLAQQREKGFDTLEKFLEHPALAGLHVDKSALGVSSRYFLFRAEAEIADSSRTLSSLIYRGPQGPVVLARSPEEDI
jgi:general secretion pathway protein K